MKVNAYNKTYRSYRGKGQKKYLVVVGIIAAVVVLAAVVLVVVDIRTGGAIRNWIQSFFQ